MANTAHVESLTKRHEELQAAIDAEIKHPSSNDLRVVELKRKKLLIKDQIAELTSQSPPN